MEVQNYRGYNPIGKWGCAFCSLGKLAEQISGETLTDAQVMDTYAESVSTNLMGWNCFIKRWDSVLGLFLYRLLGYMPSVHHIGSWNADTGLRMFGRWKEEEATHEVVRLSTKWGHHFGLHNWDPWPELERGNLDGRRLLHVALLDEEAA